MDSLFSIIGTLGAGTFAAACAITLVAGTIKGLTGFAMPMIMISGLSLLMPPELALAALIIPTVVTNGVQALRQGWSAALAVVRRFRLYLGCLLVMLLISAQLVRTLPAEALYLLIGVPVTGFALLNLSGWVPKLPAKTNGIEAAVGGFSGFIGGVSGVWGPPTVAYLTALNMPKAAHVQAQGVIYATGALALLGAHLQSGVLRAETAPLSVLMLVPGLLGMMIGQRVQDRIDQKAFRRATLFVLLIAGLNLVRRGLL
ncbi:sulfite exporter TauE/SafE family protein [Flavimaricola marinus]|uniref:Probable membrane transporter protein n=1 Tax=Flavimaricola marinus TaxID=1819565 RepID=A0A238LA01_9RHOB|nr:sulfite exporter TauE/SafE family protein [Flavimaricola marinus]SMY06488.1 Sulfite exporter TauE/SafE [Flavimaricola marinus]